MKINTKIRYGLRTMIEIGCCQEPNGMFQKDIAQNQNISVKYLDSIISSLKLKGLVANSRGKGSGYVLTRATTEISMLDIYTAFQRVEIVDCINNKNFCEKATQNCKAHCYWKDFQTDFVDMLAKKSLHQIINDTIYACSICAI